MAYVIDGTLGVDPARVDADPAFELGHTVRGDQNRTYLYVQAGGALSGSGIAVDGSFSATDTGSGNYTTITDMASGEYGWVYVDTTA